MNQKCKVCGEPAAGFHFGAFTCEGCKSFFGRTYSNLSAVGDCKNGGDCVINKKNRTSCKACRLRKCILVGMSKNGSRYGRRSNWFKIHCLLQEQTGIESPFTSNPLTSSMYSSLSPGSVGNAPSIDGSTGARKSASPASSISGTSTTNCDEEISDEAPRISTSPQLGHSSRASPEALSGIADVPTTKTADQASQPPGLLAIAASPIHRSPLDFRGKTRRLPSLKAVDPSSPNGGLLTISASVAQADRKRNGSSAEDLLPRIKMARLAMTKTMAEPTSPKAGLMASYQLKIQSSPFRSMYEPRYSRPVYEEDQETGAIADVPEQDDPIDLSFKATTAPPSGPLCLLKAEIFRDLSKSHHHKENDAAPLDLTTKG